MAFRGQTPFQGVVFREKMVISHSQQIKNFLVSLVKRGQSKDSSVAMYLLNSHNMLKRVCKESTFWKAA